MSTDEKNSTMRGWRLRASPMPNTVVEFRRRVLGSGLELGRPDALDCLQIADMEHDLGTLEAMANAFIDAVEGGAA
jgi:hypothetical protein